jgi:hypothetical protein
MKFETKYLIRWGIPGWVFLMWFFVASFGIIDPLTQFIVNKVEFLKLAGFIVTLITIGVPVGYLFHQIYFSWEWLNKEKAFFIFRRKKAKDTLIPIKEKIENQIENQTWTNQFHEDYFYIEYLWHSYLLKVEEEKRNYLSERVRHFLTIIHGLGALLYSLVTSVVLINFYWIGIDNWKEALGLTLLIIVQLLLILCTHLNYNYYSKNLTKFQAYFIHEIINSEKEKEEKIPEQKIIISLE